MPPAPLVFRILMLTCPHCQHAQRHRVREVNDLQVLPPCPGCGRPRGARTQIELAT